MGASLPLSTCALHLAGSATCSCLRPGLPGPVGSVLPGQPVPTLSFLLTFLGYSGSCQRARPAEPFAPLLCGCITSGGCFFPDSPLCLHGTSGLARARGSVWSRPWSRCMARWAQDMPERWPGRASSSLASLLQLGSADPPHHFQEVSAGPCSASACTSRSKESEKHLQVDVTLAISS